jgi:type III secretion protein J
MTRRALGGLLAATLALAGCSVPIASGLEETDANRVVVALEEGNIAADKEADPTVEGRFRVLVARDDASGAAQVLKRENLPPPSAPGVLEALGESSLVPSRTAEQAKLVTGTAGDLERSLRAVDGVLSARVHLAVPTRNAFEGDAKPADTTASVLIRHRGATPPLAVKDVQSLVAGAVPGLSVEHVSVVMTPAATGGHPLDRELSRLGPITVTKSSLTPLRAAVGLVALVNLTLLGLLLMLWSKVRRTQAALEEARAAGLNANTTSR